MSTLYEAAQELKQLMEKKDVKSGEALVTMACAMDADIPTLERLADLDNPGALNDYMLACYISHAEKNK